MFLRTIRKLKYYKFRSHNNDARKVSTIPVGFYVLVSLMMIYCFTVKTGNHLWEDRFALSCDDLLLFKHSTKYLVLVHVFISCDFEDAKNRC